MRSFVDSPLILQQITQFGILEDNLNWYHSWGKLTPKEQRSWSRCLRQCHQVQLQYTKYLLEIFIANKFSRHIQKGICCVDGCNQERTMVLNFTSLFRDENSDIRRVYHCLYCSPHFKEYRKFI